MPYPTRGEMINSMTLDSRQTSGPSSQGQRSQFNILFDAMGKSSLSTNLYNALRRLREHRSFDCLWIDFLCIDQTDVRERNEQVQKMRQIYSNARMVPIWLGDLTIMALNMIKKFNQSDSAGQDYQIRAGDIYDPDAMLALGLPTFPSPEWEALHKLFER
ncbi:hypothetical protein ABVK25_008723 [Lepraria finkii]|uniref:Heterokaryon incompatibility domain-containing protein n=1 Tax=Lepraria finkii TaxID=1340010 RepID=A0ABR4AZ96_9LECA